MEQQVKSLTRPEDVVPRFCGYCSNKFNLNQVEFLIHVDRCEKIKADEYHTKKGNKR